MNRVPGTIFCLFLLLVSCTKDKGQLAEPVKPPTPTYCDSVNVSFKGTIQPIIQTKCLDLGCHGGGYASGDLQTYVGVKAKVDNGTLKETTVTKKTMPQPATGIKLTPMEIKQMQCWLDKGAPDN